MTSPTRVQHARKCENDGEGGLLFLLRAVR